MAKSLDISALVAAALDVSRETSGLDNVELAIRALVRADGSLVPPRKAMRGLFRAGLRHADASAVYARVGQVVELSSVAAATCSDLLGSADAAKDARVANALRRSVVRLANGVSVGAPGARAALECDRAVRGARLLEAVHDGLHDVAYPNRNDSGAREDYRARVEVVRRPRMVRGGL